MRKLKKVKDKTKQHYELTGIPRAHDLAAAMTAFGRPFIPRPSSA
jgi:hypothetical protein